MKRVIFLICWIMLTIFYCWNLSDVGRSMGANTNSAIEAYSEMMVKYGGTTTDSENLGSAMADMWSYGEFHNLSKEFKTDFTIIGVTTVIYIFMTILFYHFGLKTKRLKEKTM